jgi:TetR/AcrR family transcriptional repressor of nem operon
VSVSLKADQKSRTRAAILASSAKLLRERGIVGARVADVMAGAGLTVGGFYAHWPSKEALVDETLASTAEGMRERLFARLEDKPAADRAEVVVKRYLTAAHRDATDEGCCFPAVASEIATTAPEHAPALAAQIEALAEGLRAHVPERPGLAPRQLALGLAALMVGGLTLARATRGTPLSDQVLASSRALARAVLGRT